LIVKYFANKDKQGSSNNVHAIKNVYDKVQTELSRTFGGKEIDRLWVREEQPRQNGEEVLKVRWNDIQGK
jgi:hypothetical protein